jgi:hypothetical protein
MDKSLVCYSPIDERHRFTGACKHTVHGERMGAMAGLMICHDGREQAFYLFRCDQDWRVVTDTWHPTLDEAKHQAEFDYEGISRSWIYVT